MKKLFILFLFSLIFISVSAATPWDGTTIATSFAGGDGSAGNPYQISTPAELAYLSQSVNGANTYAATYFILTSDLDLNSKSWTPIGNSTTSFKGTFDGNSHLISNLTVNLPTSTGVGLFGYTDSALIKKLGIAGVSTIIGQTYVGGIIGRCTLYPGGYFVRDCFSNATVSASGERVGGIVGSIRSAQSVEPSLANMITNCYSTGNITGSNYVAGIVGHIEYKTAGIGTLIISNSYSTGTMTATGTGALKGGIVTKISTASVNVTNSYYINGDAGNANGAVAKTAAEMQTPGFVTTLNGSQSPAPWVADLIGVNSVNNGFPTLFWRIDVISDAPASVVAVAGNTQVSVMFTPPVNDGGTPILDYTVTPFIGSVAGIPVTTKVSPVVITGLVNGTTYTFKVTARNLVGISASTTSNAVIPKIISYPLTTHPRLFFLPEDEAVLKAKLAATPILTRVHNVIIAECDKMLTLPVLQRVMIGKRLLEVSREALRRICFLSYAYRMTGIVAYADRAIVEMKAMAAFSDWNPLSNDFLDTGEMTLGMAIGYDWLYNYMDASSRTTIANAIKSMGIERSVGPGAYVNWLTEVNNRNQVNNAGVSAGVAAVYDTNPTYYQTLIDRSINSIWIPMGLYSNNGATPEGYGYWDYGTSFNALFLNLLQRMWGTDSGLSAMPGFLSTGNYLSQLEGNATKGGTATPQCFNFADAGSGTGPMVAMYWLADQTSNPNLLYNELKKMDVMITTNSTSPNKNRLLPFALIWSMNQTLTGLVAPTETTYVAQGKSALGVLRSGWGANDIYLAIKGGTPNWSHCQMDIGSFVMDAMDVRWAMDLGASDYTMLEANNVPYDFSQTSAHWDVFRYKNSSHNTLTINGNRQLVAGCPTVDNLINTTDRKSVDINLTSIYANDVSYCRRTAAIVQNRYVEIKDSLKAGSTAVTVRWNLVTQATPLKVSNKIIRLTQLGKNLYLVFDGTDNVLAKTWSQLPTTSYEERNADAFLTGFEYTVPAGATQAISVKMVPEGDPVLNGLVLTANGCLLNENFEAFAAGSQSTNDFVNWKMVKADAGALKAVLGEVVTNPFKGGINTSNQVLKITRQSDSTGITPTSYNFTYRGTQGYGYDLRFNAGMIVEFKYYKVVKGTVGIRIGEDGHLIYKSFTDPNESSPGYSTSQWRTAQFTLTASDVSALSATGSRYLMILPNPNNNYNDQVGEIVMYVDDVKFIPLLSTIEDVPTISELLTAYYDSNSKQVFVQHLPQNCQKIMLYNVLGSKLQEVQVQGNEATVKVGKFSGSVLIVQAICSDGKSSSAKVMCFGK
jgi:hypothetical protein